MDFPGVCIEKRFRLERVVWPDRSGYLIAKTEPRARIKGRHVRLIWAFESPMATSLRSFKSEDNMKSGWLEGVRKPANLNGLGIRERCGNV
jgi:hypothetical protein